MVRKRNVPKRANFLVVLLAALIAACSDVSLGPSIAASLEFPYLPAPALAIGDSLRDANGLAAPARAIVRNQQGEIVTNAPVRFFYADAIRDTAVFVDSLTGYIVSLKAFSGSATTARIAARVGATLQAIRTVQITIRPDSVAHTGSSTIDTLRTTLPDTGRAAASANSSAALTVTVRHVEGSTATLVPNWLVKYELLRPANPTNDSTASVFLVNEARTVSNIDTTDASGIASRFVRVRSSRFPASAAVDSAVVRVTVSYKGLPVKGAPIRLVVPIIRKP